MSLYCKALLKAKLFQQIEMTWIDLLEFLMPNLHLVTSGNIKQSYSVILIIYIYIYIRYEPPVVSAGWGTEVLDATADMDKNLDSKMCLQIQQGRLSSTNIVGSEDCLFVNVWVGGTVDGKYIF